MQKATLTKCSQKTYPEKKIISLVNITGGSMSSSNRRKYERRLIHKFALLKLANGITIEGQTRDMSIGGAFIECAQDDIDLDLTEGDECTISMVLEEGDEELTTEIYGNISHHDSQGIGCNFLKINLVYYQFISEQYD